MCSCIYNIVIGRRGVVDDPKPQPRSKTSSVRTILAKYAPQFKVPHRPSLCIARKFARNVEIANGQSAVLTDERRFCTKW